jgi:NAD-dependent deacetylase
MRTDVDVLADFFAEQEHRHLLVVTGAGISLASGISTFRGEDPDAIWKKDVTELGTFRYFATDPVGSWRWYLSRFEKTVGAKPNPAHLALVALEDWHVRRGGEWLLVTQNIDGLHRQAGAKNLVEVHGRADRIRCPRTGCAHGAPAGSLPRSTFDLDRFAKDPTPASLPRCPACASIMRQHVLWFDEYYDSHRDYGWPRVLEAAGSAEAVLFIGTSFSVGVTDLVLTAALDRGRPVMSIDPAAGKPHSHVALLQSRAEDILPAVCKRFAIAWS